jgi:hypothetical protein
VADAGGACGNPRTGEPDVAPMAPQATRNLFAVVSPPLAEMVSHALDRTRNEDRTSSAAASSSASSARSSARMLA